MQIIEAKMCACRSSLRSFKGKPRLSSHVADKSACGKQTAILKKRFESDYPLQF